MTTIASPTPELKTDKPPRPRRWIPLSLRMIVVILGIVGVVAGWDGMRIYRRHVAIQTLRRHGGVVITEPTAPTWLRQWLGHDRIRSFDDVTMVLWQNSVPLTISDTEMPAFEQLDRVHLVDLRGAPITDAGLKHLARLRNLKEVNVRFTLVTDAGVDELQRKLPELAIYK